MVCGQPNGHVRASCTRRPRPLDSNSDNDDSVKHFRQTGTVVTEKVTGSREAEKTTK